MVSGWVTNNSDETWTAVNVHAFIAADPITTSSDLAFESTRGVEESVGDRITVPGTFDTIPELAPGASASYTDRIPVSLLGADEPGVYWFGVHALGTSEAGRDVVADGRARTFLPYVPAEDRGRAHRHRPGAAGAPPGAERPRRHPQRRGRLARHPGRGWPARVHPRLRPGRRRTSADLAGRPRGTRRRRPPHRRQPPARAGGARRCRHRRGHGGGAAPVRRRQRVVGPPGARAVGGAGRRRRGLAGQAQPGGDRQAGAGPAVGRRRRRRSGQARHRRLHRRARALGLGAQRQPGRDDTGDVGAERLPRRRGARPRRRLDHGAGLRPGGRARPGAQRGVVRRPQGDLLRRRRAQRRSGTRRPARPGGDAPADPQRGRRPDERTQPPPSRRGLPAVVEPAQRSGQRSGLLRVLHRSRRELDAAELSWPTPPRSPGGRWPPTASTTRSGRSTTRSTTQPSTPSPT